MSFRRNELRDGAMRRFASLHAHVWAFAKVMVRLVRARSSPDFGSLLLTYIFAMVIFLDSSATVCVRMRRCSRRNEMQDEKLTFAEELFLIASGQGVRNLPPER